MFTAIPDAYLVTTLLTVILTSVVVFVTIYLAAYQESRADALEMKKQALVDKDAAAVKEAEIYLNFDSIYVIALFVGAAVTVVLAYLAMQTVVPEYYDLADKGDYIVMSIVASIVVGLLTDYVFVHRIADGTFKQEVLNPLEEQVVGGLESAAGVDTAADAATQANALIAKANEILAAAKKK